MQTFNQMGSCLNCRFKAAKRVFIVRHQQLTVVLSACKKSHTIRAYDTFIITCIILLLSSCQKENLSDGTLINSSTLPSNLATAKSKDYNEGNGPNEALNYGALICPPDGGPGWLGFQQNVAGQLGVTCLRGSTIVPGVGISPAILTSGYGVLLNFNTNNDQPGDDDDDNGNGDQGNHGGGNQGNNQNGDKEAAKQSDGPTPFVKDLTQYKLDLTSILALCIIKPVVAVIENEESNRFYYSGSALDYIKQLNAAINVMHANGIKVANGGITSGGLNYLVYQDFIDQGKYDSAEQFRKITHVTPKSPFTQDRGAFVDSLLQAYNQMDLDYVNFHWKAESPDTEALNDVINYLKKRSNKPIINNELGQFDKDPNTLLTHVELCTNQKLPYIIWYSPDENDSKKATPLQYDDATLTPTGDTYQNYLAR